MIESVVSGAAACLPVSRRGAAGWLADSDATGIRKVFDFFRKKEVLQCG